MPPARDASVEQFASNAQTLAASTDAVVAPKLLRGALAPCMAEVAALLLRVSAVALLLSPILLPAALLLG